MISPFPVSHFLLPISCFPFPVSSFSELVRDDVDQVWDGGVAPRPRHLGIAIRHLRCTEIEEDSLWCL